MAVAEKPLPRFTTSRLDLRPRDPDDAPLLFDFEQRCAAAPDAERFMLRPPPRSVDEVRARLVPNQGPFSESRTVFSWLVRERGKSPIVGYVAFVRWDHAHHRTEVAYVIDPALRGMGLAVEGTAQILTFAWDELGLHRAEAHIDPENRASIRTAEKLGFVHEGTLRENVLVRGRYVDTAIYARLR